ncbi:protein of unknown function [Zhouia amylolytica]|uniref:DUF748 domain-containing protein n=2 Tax=Zhouia amylolytica TaxID=376730 RepID=A0A1I6PJK1_9FLAO|nr:protein of unknown function [Zhouia amylolytica]
MKIRKRHIRNGLSLLFLVIIIIMLALPSFAKNYLIKNSKELVGRQIDMEKLSINYFTSTLKVYNFKMYEANDKDVFTSFDTLLINAAPLKYFSNVKALEQFYLEGLRVNISKKDSVFNYDDLIAYHSVSDSIQAKPSEKESVKYLLENLELKNASFLFYNANVDDETRIDNFSFFIPRISWDQEQESNANLKFNLDNNGYIESDFNMFPQTGEFNGAIRINELQLNSFYKYAAQYARINTLEGTVNATFNFNGNSKNPNETVLSGEVETLKLMLTDQNNQKILGGEKVTCKLKKIDPAKASYIIESLNVEEPYIKFELDTVSNNLSRIFNPFEDLKESDEKNSENLSGEKKIYYAINNVEVKNGVLDYTDNLTGKPFDYHLSEILIDTDSINSESEWVEFTSDMLLNNRGTLKAEVGFNPANLKNMHLDIAIKDFLLSDLNIYANYYAGHSVLRGDMFYFTDSKITNGIIESNNNLLIKNVSVENIKGGLYSLPLKFAVLLLKDKNGDIELTVPVRGDLNKPEIDVWKIVWATLKKLIFNTTKNPVKHLAQLVDAKPKDLEQITFKYPDTIINTEQQRKLDLLLRLEKIKPGLQIEMNYIADNDLLREEIAKANGLDSLTNASEDTIYENIKTNLPADSLSRDSLSVEIGLEKSNLSPQLDSIAQQYSDALILNVKNYLKTKQPETIIKVQKADQKKPENIGAVTQFKMKYTMKDSSAGNKEELQETPYDKN